MCSTLVPAQAATRICISSNPRIYSVSFWLVHAAADEKAFFFFLFFLLKNVFV